MFIIALDFDGTMVEHVFPNIGAPVPGAIEWVKRFQEESAKIFLWTMRSHNQKFHNGTKIHDTLDDAIEYFNNNGIELWGINENPDQHLNDWSNSNKQYANIYIDDAAAGCPLKSIDGKRPFVDWEKIGPLVLEKIKA